MFCKRLSYWSKFENSHFLNSLKPIVCEWYSTLMICKDQRGVVCAFSITDQCLYPSGPVFFCFHCSACWLQKRSEKSQFFPWARRIAFYFREILMSSVWKTIFLTFLLSVAHFCWIVPSAFLKLWGRLARDSFCPVRSVYTDRVWVMRAFTEEVSSAEASTTNVQMEWYFALAPFKYKLGQRKLLRVNKNVIGGLYGSLVNIQYMCPVIPTIEDDAGKEKILQHMCNSIYKKTVGVLAWSVSKIYSEGMIWWLHSTLVVCNSCLERPK